MKNMAISCLAATALLVGCSGSGGSSSEDQGPPAECPEVGTQPSQQCLDVGGGEFVKSKEGAFGYKIVPLLEQVSDGAKTSNKILVVFDKNQCEGAMNKEGTGTFKPWMDGHDHGLDVWAEKVRTVRDEECKNVFKVDDVFYTMPGKWQLYLQPKIVRGKDDIGKREVVVTKK